MKKMKNRFGLGFVAMVAVTLLAGCKTASIKPSEAVIPDLYARFTPIPVQIDGKLDDPAWKGAAAYPMGLADNLTKAEKGPIEPGTVQFAWDQNNFYMAVSFTDSDVVAEGTSNGQHHYSLGDLAELFLWPEDQTWYVELYVTPGNHYTTFLFPSGGRILPSIFATNAFPLRVAARIEGTLNDCADHDRAWTGEMAVPVKEFTARGASWGADTRWRVLVGRYNYSRWLFRQELSECPRLPATSFHLRENYGRLRLLAPNDGAVTED